MATDFATPDLSKAQVMTVYACYTNTDLTEGKGKMYAFAWAWSPAAAKRLAHKKGVMGSDAVVETVFAIKIGNVVYVPAQVEQPTHEDTVKDKHNDARALAMSKARAVGLSDDEIALLVKPPL